MSAYVLATDGLLYRDPVIAGPGWYVVFDGFDDPEVVVAAMDGPDELTPAQARLRAVSVLEQSGLSAVLSGPPRLNVRAFDREGLDRRLAYSFWLGVSGPIPREALPADSDGVTRPSGEGLVVSFGCAWG